MSRISDISPVILSGPVSTEGHTPTPNGLPRVETHPHWTQGELSGQRLQGYDCRGADFRGKQLWSVDLSTVDCSGAIFDGADLAHADCTDTVFVGATFVNTTTTSAVFTRVDLTNAVIRMEQLLRTKTWSRVAPTIVGLDALQPWHDAETTFELNGPELARPPIHLDLQ